ncbi:MAG: S9 family peptidase [Flavobacteriaceae bacterium]|nr:S9 family peptidase [Flavobacteriaceae bacterium]
MKQPMAAKREQRLELHGDLRIDEYYWLKDRENPEVLEFLAAENSYREHEMAPLKDLTEELFAEMTGRLDPNESSLSIEMDGYWYQSRYCEGQDYPIHVRFQGAEDGPEELLLDVNVLAEGRSYCQVASMVMTRDHRRMAYAVDFVSRRQFTLRFRDVATGLDHAMEIHDTSGAFAWADDGETFFYATKDAKTLRVDKVWRQTLGSTEPSVLVFHETDEAFSCTVYRGKSKNYLMISTSATNSDEVWYLKASEPLGAFICLRARQNGLEYSASHHQESWWIRSNLEGRRNFALFSSPLLDPSAWSEVIAHREHVLLEGIDLFDDFLVREERELGLLRIVIRPWDEALRGPEYQISMPEETYTLFTSSNPSAATRTLRYAYTSLSTPMTTYDFDMVTREQRVKKVQKVVGGYDPDRYVTRRIWARAPDGTQVPISWVGPADRKGPIPTLLYGYGAYGMTVDPSFSVARLSLLERGMAYAIAHIRGGEYLGRMWYEQGRMADKQNTFSDFIACGDFLKSEAWASDLFAMGGSAGGLLVAAVVNQRPDLWSGVIAAVPFVDVVTTMLDDSIPLTTGEYDEWGNPNEAEAYFCMKAYSPYDNVAAQDYPPMLVTTGLHDSQVQYFEPAKWVARLRDRRTNSAPLYLYCNMDTGHGGASGRYESYRETAMEYAFLLGLKT